MTNDDYDAFGERIVALGELFNTQFSSARSALYFEALRDLSFEDVVQAMNISVRTSKWLPKPAELREIICGDSDEAIEVAWVVFREAMQRSGAYASIVTLDPALGASIRTVFGSWPQACSTDLSPEMWSSKRKEWGRVYSMLRRRGGQPAYLPGLTEQANAGRTDWAKYISVIVIDGPTLRALTAADAQTYRTLPAPETFSSPRELVGTIAANRDEL